MKPDSVRTFEPKIELGKTRVFLLEDKLQLVVRNNNTVQTQLT